MSKGRVHQIHRTLRTALNEAHKREKFAKNPVTHVRVAPPEPPVVEPFTVDEVRTLFTAVATRRNAARWVLALAVGLRQGATLALRWQNLDFVHRGARITTQKKRPRYEHGCNPACGKQHAGYCPDRRFKETNVGTTKSAAGTRFVPLPAQLLDLLAAHKTIQDDERVHAGTAWREGGWVFTNPDGTPPSNRTNWGEWKRLLQAAGIRDARLHDVRHTAATVLMMLNIHPRVMMKVMGWSPMNNIERYAHVVDVSRQDTASKVGSLLWEADQ